MGDLQSASLPQFVLPIVQPCSDEWHSSKTPAEERLPEECGDEGARRGRGRDGFVAERDDP